jgi:hypothetical protein
MDPEAPDADAAEQHLDAAPDADDEEAGDEPDELALVEELPLEADQADAAEQARVVGQADDEYR